ncbi:MAG: porin family protein [Alphaproteobacteria bacterium]|nr:porin family protein [Alphaproteobacteria bacterium]
MKYSALPVLLISTLSALSAYAARPGAANLYVSVSGDVSVANQEDVSGLTTGSVHYDKGYGGNVALGFRPTMLNNRSGAVRFEAEGGYHTFGLDKVNNSGSVNPDPNGHLNMTTAMGNIYYDMRATRGITSYVGGGLGWARLNFPTSNGLGNTSSSDNNMAYQAMAGISFTPSSMPQTDITLGYRYLGVASSKFKGVGGEVKLDSFVSSGVEAGLRYHF